MTTTKTVNSKARISIVERNTAETRIALRLTIEGRGQYKVATGIRFFDHMLELFTRHGAFDLELECDGDLDVDQHHTVEDVGIALGEAFDRALGDKRGIFRAGYFLMPMDETLAIAAVDLSGRAAFAVETKVRTRLVGDLQTELVTDFFEGFARGARANVHVKTMYGTRSRRFSRPLRGRCALHARATNNSQECCHRQKDCCNARDCHRLQGGQFNFGIEGAPPSRL
jgi:imidazoleglycerol-phosphate dehydratase